MRTDCTPAPAPAEVSLVCSRAMDRSRLFALFVLCLIPATLRAATFPCKPCAGVRLDPISAPTTPSEAPVATPAGTATTPSEIANLLKQIARLEPGSPFHVAWDVPLDSLQNTAGPSAEELQALRQAGATPWLSLVFRTPAPLAQNSARLQTELRVAAEVAGRAPKGSWFQVIWRPEGQETAEPAAGEYGFLLKRAAVTLTGAHDDARVATQPLAADVAALEALYNEEIAAYLEALVLQPAPEAALTAALEAVQQRLDPGRSVVLDGLPFPEPPAEVLAEAARQATRGFDLTLFRAPSLPPAAARPLALLALEFSGDLSWDPGSSPEGAPESWAFVRGKDLALRVIVLAPEVASALDLRFPDPGLRRPARFPFEPGQVVPPSGRVTATGLDLRIEGPGRVTVLGLERATAEEREGIAQQVTVESQREIPVEEILRRLQAFEDAQDRKLDHYSATNTTHLRFQPAAGTQTFEATLQGPFFFSDSGADWAWETMYVNGVKWRGKTLPEIPLIQPEKTAAAPLQIHFTKQYRYRLRGTDRVNDRDAWVVDFAPAGPGEEGKLYQGTVWVDRQIWARLRTRAVQIGLEGEVISNEETMEYSAIDAQGNPAPWAAESFIMPLRLVAQQILSILNNTTVVERETLLSEVRINGTDFEEKRAQVEQSEATMVRDTELGLRYLVKDDSGQRVVKEGFDTNKLFLAGGVFYDDALDYPLPLGGINYFSFDFLGKGQQKGNQLNVFFAGALLTVNVAQPRLFGSRFDFGGDFFAIAVPFADTVYSQDVELEEQEVENRPASLGLKLGHPLGNFTRLSLEYDVVSAHYGETDNTGDDFVLPSDNLTHSVELGTSFSRAGYGLSARGSYSRRSEWSFWGLPDNPDWTEDKQDFLRWQARASKNWYLPRFQKVGVEIDYAGGSDLDRFSKYQFGFFGGTRVHGYQSNRVRAEEAWAAHLSYGFEIGEFLRLDAVGDMAWATDEATGLDNEMLAGVGLAGTFIGPWQTIVNLDVGMPVAGPDDGFVLYIVFLKLFR